MLKVSQSYKTRIQSVPRCSFGPPGTIWKIWSLLTLFETIYNNSGPFQTNWAYDNLKVFESILNHLILFRILWNYLESFRKLLKFFWFFLPSWALQATLDYFLTILSQFGLYSNMGTFFIICYSFWIILDIFRPFGTMLANFWPFGQSKKCRNIRIMHCRS